MKTPFRFGAEGAKIVYVKPVASQDLPQDLRDQVGAHETVFSVHTEDGVPLALVPDRALAFSLARQHDFAPVSVH